MDNSQKFTEYAEFCERLAKTATTDDKKVLLDIAKAWRLLAKQAEPKGAGIQSDKSRAPAVSDGGGLQIYSSLHLREENSKDAGRTM
jgi:hypothetical protein